MTKLPEGGFHSGDIYAYRYLAGLIPYDGKMVELGSHRGRSICSIARILNERRVSVTLVDKFLGLPENPHVTEVVSGVAYEDADELHVTLEQNLIAHGLAATIVAGDSAETASRFADRSVDLVFVDADHQYDAVLRDLAAWWPKVSMGGRIAGHDYTVEFEHPRAKQRYGASGGYHAAAALRDFFKQGREIKRAPQQNQTTVWYVNADPEDDMVLVVASRDDMERSLRTHLRPEGHTGVVKRQRILDLITELGYPTQERATYAAAADPQLKAHLSSCSFYISMMLRSGHLKLVRRGDV